MTTGRHEDTNPTRPLTDPVADPVPHDGLGPDLDSEATREVVTHEERMQVGTEVTESGRVKVRKHVETYPVEEAVERQIEHADTSERAPALEDDSGLVETLADGSVSIPVFEEVLVVTKKLVVRERVIVRKHTVIDEHVLQTELRREHVSVEAEGDVQVSDPGAPALGSTLSDPTSDADSSPNPL